MLALRGLRVHAGLRGHQALQDRLAGKGLPVLPVAPGRQDNQDFRVQRDIRAAPGRLDHKDVRARREIRANPGRLDHKDVQAKREIRAALG